MAEQGRMARTGATPGKLVLIAVLAIVLVVVLVVQFGGDAEPTAANAKRPLARRRPALPVVKASLAPRPVVTPHVVTTTTAVKHWSPIPMEEIRQYDPFALPSWGQVAQAAPAEQSSNPATNQDPRDAERRTALAKLMQQGVSIVVVNGDRRTATIGERTVAVGDTLLGYRVKAITATGVVLDDSQP